MSTAKAREAVEILREAIRELESPKGSICGAVQKLARAAELVDDQDTCAWSKLQLGDPVAAAAFKELADWAEEETKTTKPTGPLNPPDELLKRVLQKMIKFGLDPSGLSQEEFSFKVTRASGGFSSVGFIEERYADLVRRREGNDGTYYKNNLNEHLSLIRREAHARASKLYSLLAYSDAPESAFDLMKAEVDDKLLDLSPDLAERLMAIFKAISSNKPEEWSQALTSCRRIIEGLADTLFPPRNDAPKGRPLGKANYINRLWAFMDAAIDSDSNKELAKAHVDFLGAYLERTVKLAHKGVHANLRRVEAVKAVFHTYLVIADLLGYLRKEHVGAKTAINIHSATLDELESLLGISRQVAKEIIKLRVQKPALIPEDLASIRTIGKATIARAGKTFVFAEESSQIGS